MKTKCIVIGEDNQEKKEKKPIKFFREVILDFTPSYDFPLPLSLDYKNIELIRRASLVNHYDVLFAYNDAREHGVLYLGHWNDGIIE